MSQKVCIYSRVSTDDGKQDTKGQVGILIDFVKSHGFRDDQIEVFEENLSGYIRMTERPILNKISSIIHNDPKYFSTVYVTELSRLGRTPKDVKNLVEEWTDLGVNIYVKDKNLQTIIDGERSMFTQILVGMFVEFYNFESQTFKARSRYGLLRAVRSGKMGGGIYHLYGYRKDADGMMVIDDEESKVVKRIFELYIEGNGVKIISNILNKDNIPTKTKRSFPNKILNKNTGKKGKDIKWSDGQIYNILTNNSYIGERKFLDHIVDCPIIIDREIFSFCQEKLKERNSKGNSEYIYLLKGIITCGSCGRNYVGRFKPEVRGDKVYKCSSTRIGGGTACNNKGVNIKQIESVLYHFSFHIMEVVNYINFSREIRTDLSSKIKILQNESKSVEYDIDKIDIRQKRLLETFLDGQMEKRNYYDMKDSNEKSLVTKNKRLKEIKREIQVKTKELNSTTHTEFLKSKENRNLLTAYFSKVFQKITIESTNRDSYLMIVEILLLNDNKFIFEILVDKKGIRKRDQKYYYIIKSGKLIYDNELITFSEKNVDELPPITERNIVTFNRSSIENYAKKKVYITEQISSDEYESAMAKTLINDGQDGSKFKLIKLLSNSIWNPVWYDVNKDFIIDMKEEVS